MMMLSLHREARSVLRRIGVLVLALALAGCGGGGSSNEQTTTAAATTSAAPNPGATLKAMLAAARAGEAEKLGNLLRPDSPDSLVPELMEGLGSFPAGTPIVLSVPIDDQFAVAALAGPRRAEGRKEPLAAYAVALQRYGDQYKASLVSPVQIRPLGPDPGSTQGPVSQVAAEFSAPTRLDQAGLWVDGKAIAAEPRGTPRKFTAFGSSGTLKPGWHSVVAFGEAGGSAGATAWTFRVR
jgi:hypothetical protein